MDLRGILNTSDTGGAQKQPPTRQPQPQLQQPPPQHQHMAQSPSTPSQPKPPFQYDYPHPHQSPGKPVDFPHPPQRQQSMPYPAQSPYQSPAPYPPRPAPPSIQEPGYPNVQSPVATPMSAQKPYNRASSTPLAAGPPGAGGSYFPGQHTPTEMQSPIQQHQQYPPNSYPPRDGYQPGGPGPVSGPHGPGGPFRQQQSPVLQTPSTPGAPASGSHPYPHQRSQSTHSVTNTPTPTSAHSQHPPYASSFHQQPPPPQQPQQRSPVAASRPPIAFNRQHSQPPGPPGPPIPTPSRQSSDISPSFGHPSSPHIQRMSSVGPGIPQAHPQQQQPPPPPPPLQHQTHGSPPPPTPMTGVTNRIPSTHTSPIQQASELRRTSQPRSDRDRSMSVSPKTHVKKLQNNHLMALPTSEPQHHSVNSQRQVVPPSRADGAMTPAKRKMDDRDTDDDSDRREVRPRQGDAINGKPAPVTPRQPPSRSNSSMTGAPIPTPGLRASTSPTMQKKRKPKPRMYSEPPIWAQSVKNNQKLKRANFEFPKRKHSTKASPINGRASTLRPEHKSRHTSPEIARPQGSQPPPPSQAVTPAPPLEPNAEITAILGPWEPTIANVKPLDEINKAVADFLFLNVVNNQDAEEIASLGIAFEVEAKLGTIIDKDTNERVAYPVASECLLRDRGQLAFRSSMTEAQHKGLNDYLNRMVIEADPRNPAPGARRVQLHYKHRREEDCYFELPPALRDTLPGCVRALMRPRHTPKARVTYEQRSREVVAKIVKVRVADLSIHMPNSPLDCRISVNLEMNWPGPVEELEQIGGGRGENMPARQKDRLSYAQGSIQVDLTQVTTPTSGPVGAHRPGKEHELEIELSASTIIEQGRRLMSHEPHKYPELVEAFVDNIRLLSRKTGEFVGR
ncbi:hypothetical protein jhhlp_004743 [Lomentospora prolificans]|uniref:mRNA-capping enzyme subunit beta n=1 Tax=Lomentospora prolificans TaxID=41688 RepID=A0A2N3N8A6_9PEZI|nr:hypothetical protein jhhlp_004743 [Lomentospora prolificans]